MPVGFEIFQKVSRPASDLLERFRGIPTADLGDVMHKRGAFASEIAAMYRPLRSFVGTAVTVSVPDGAFEVIKLAIQTAQPGDVIVINARGNTNHALLGDNVCRGMKARGIAGLVVDGAVRDRSTIQADDFPVFARGTALIMGAIQGSGEVNVPIACGGVVVNPGDIIVADEDGVIAVQPHRAEEVLDAAQALHLKHQSARPVLLRGEVTDIENIHQRAVSRGGTFFDGPFPAPSNEVLTQD
jgi:4-hydroxy-4-methyl-2-oxoglutarate aldolase